MPDTPVAFEGGCTCRKIRYRMTAKPMFVHCCHCRWCQRESGAAFALNAMIEADRVELLAGSPETVDTPSNSGRGQRVVRCPDCKVAVWSHYAMPRISDLVRFVRVGSLDEPDSTPPDVHIFTGSKQPWVTLPDNARVFEQYYDTQAEWPEASLARREALLGQS